MPPHTTTAKTAQTRPLVVIFGMEDPVEYEPRSPSGAVVALAGLGVAPEAVI